MTSAAYVNGSYRCYRLVNGLYRLFLGCTHATPREAIAHTSDTYVSPLRVSGETTTPVPVPPSEAGPLVVSPEPRNATLGLEDSPL